VSLPLTASVGPFTGVLEAVATSIGAGILVGGFVLGVIGSARRRPRKAIEAMAFVGGNFGGLVGLSLLTTDTLAKYVV
jgi:hypothetical protein